MASPAPLTPVQALYDVASVGVTPSCSSTMIDLTPFFLSLGTSALAVSTSSRKSTSAIPAWATIVSVSSRVMPMKPTFWPSTLKILYGLNGVGRLWPALFFQNTFAPR